MPKVRLNPLIEEIHGTMYDVVFKLSHKGNVIVTKRPDMSNVKWSQAQTAQRERFKQAVAYARAALADPKVRARYERKAKEGKQTRLGGSGCGLLSKVGRWGPGNKNASAKRWHLFSH